MGHSVVMSEEKGRGACRRPAARPPRSFRIDVTSIAGSFALGEAILAVAVGDEFAPLGALPERRAVLPRGQPHRRLRLESRPDDLAHEARIAPGIILLDHVARLKDAIARDHGFS